MRKLFLQMMVSLDGYHEGPNHALDWHVVDDDFFAYVTEMLGSIASRRRGPGSAGRRRCHPRGRPLTLRHVRTH